jgi:glycine cleavage system transcriptional repressor
VRHYAVSALGRDRPGIVERVTGVLLAHSVNIEDSQMSILRGRFTMALIVAAAPDSVAALRADLEGVATELGLDALTLHEVAEVDATHAQPTHLVTVYGADHPGIVHSAAAALASAGANITDLNTRLAGEPDGELYVLLLEAAVPAGAAESLERSLEAVGHDEGVEVAFRELEQDTL